MRRLLPLFAAAMSLGACSTLPHDPPSTVSPVCAALVGPIPYNSTNPASKRFAGPELAPDLKQRNQVGVELGCPAYR